MSAPPPSLSMAPLASYPPVMPAASATVPIVPRPSSTTTSSTAPASTASAPTPPSGPPAKKKRRSKVDSACRFCRRSHMQCSGERPCARCIKREIAHLCTDEPIAGLDASQKGGAASASPAPPAHPPQSTAPLQQASVSAAQTSPPVASLASPSRSAIDGNSMLNTLGLDMGDALSNVAAAAESFPNMLANSSLFGASQGGFGAASTSQAGARPSLFATDFNPAMLDLADNGLGAGLGLDMTMNGDGEFHGLGLSEFLQSLNDTPIFGADQASTAQNGQIGGLPINTDTGLTAPPGSGVGEGKDKGKSTGPSVPGSPINKTERFLLTAADQKDGSRSDRLARVIHAKFEAGLLKPYNHVAGYTRLMKWMADNMSASSRQRTLHTLSEFRPTFRAIASGLTDLDLVFIEEAFERLLLDYDRVFSSMGIPACLWRRTGEIYKGNKEFAALVGVPIEHLQGGKLAIYELMAEESAVNYWEKYGNIAFDASQKAVLTSCVLINQSVLSRKRKKAGANKAKVLEDAMVNACFSFTIRRDSYSIPSMIIGNFIRL
ncbi:Transcription factor [Rhodotorula toruloides]